MALHAERTTGNKQWKPSRSRNPIAIDQEGNKLHDSPFQVNRAGFVIHSAVHAAREDAHCVLHTHTRAGVSVSAQRAGVLPTS